MRGWGGTGEENSQEGWGGVSQEGSDRVELKRTKKGSHYIYKIWFV